MSSNPSGNGSSNEVQPSSLRDKGGEDGDGYDDKRQQGTMTTSSHHHREREASSAPTKISIVGATPAAAKRPQGPALEPSTPRDRSIPNAADNNAAQVTLDDNSIGINGGVSKKTRKRGHHYVGPPTPTVKKRLFPTTKTSEEDVPLLQAEKSESATAAGEKGPSSEGEEDLATADEDNEEKIEVVGVENVPNLTDQTEQKALSYTQDSNMTAQSMEEYYVQAKDSRKITMLSECSPLAEDNIISYHIGRHSIFMEPENRSNTMISKNHAALSYNPRSGSFELMTIEGTCWMGGPDKTMNKWEKLLPGHSNTIYLGDRFRLLPPGKKCKDQNIQFSLGVSKTQGSVVMAGSGSFDKQYMKLLHEIQKIRECTREGEKLQPNKKKGQNHTLLGQLQPNKKGPNWTYNNKFTLDIDLRDIDKDRNLLPLSTLRWIPFQNNMIEALWYIRGENNIKFLKDNGQCYWDEQAIEKEGYPGRIFVGLSYGLLTNYPQEDGASANQLLSKVIEPLCSGKNSRNMDCTLAKPGEETVQEACSSGVQFAVERDGSNNELLNLTVKQRSSDVILGLPSDVMVWAIILHLVRREVKIRTNGSRKLLAGHLYFSIAAGGAHVYCLNEGIFDELLRREPKPKVQPYYELHRDLDLFEMARTYNKEELKKKKEGKWWTRHGYEKGDYHPAIKIVQATGM